MLTGPPTPRVPDAQGSATARGPRPPHVLVVGSGQHFPALIRAADDRAAVTILCRSGAVAAVREPHRALRVVGVPDGAGITDWIRLAREVHTSLPVTRVAAFGELDQDKAAELGRELAVPATDPHTVSRVNDKSRMRRCLRDAGVDDTPFAVVGSAEELATFVGAHGGPCVVKPVAGAGSAGVAVIDRPDRAGAAFALASTRFDGVPDAGVVVERFHVGPQYSVETFSEGGQHQVVAVVRKYSDPDTLVELGHLTPAADLSSSDDRACREFVPEVLGAVGITDGPAHTEIVVTRRGPRVIETHVRLAGDEIPELVRLTTGVDLSDCVARQAVGQAVLADVRRALRTNTSPRYAAVWFALPPAGGRLVEIRGLADESGPVGTDGEAWTRALLEPGDEIATPPNSDSRVGLAIAVAPRAVDALGAARGRAQGLTAVIEVRPLAPADPL